MTNEQMAAVADEAVNLARQEFELELDFSGPSTAAVEELLDELRADLPQDEDGQVQLQEEDARQQVATLSSLFGAYLGEVIRRQFGGQWLEQDTHEGAMVALRVGDEVLLPPLQVYRRLLQGSEQSVWDYYQFAAHRFARTRDGLVQLTPPPQQKDRS